MKTQDELAKKIIKSASIMAVSSGITANIIVECNNGSFTKQKTLTIGSVTDVIGANVGLWGIAIWDDDPDGGSAAVGVWLPCNVQQIWTWTTLPGSGSQMMWRNFQGTLEIRRAGQPQVGKQIIVQLNTEGTDDGGMEP